MARAVTTRPYADFPRPENVVTALVDPATGFLAGPQSTNRYEEYFLAGTVPTETGPSSTAVPLTPVPATEPAPEPTPATEPGPAPEPAREPGPAPAPDAQAPAGPPVTVPAPAGPRPPQQG
jgi:hypothetical protein